MVRLIASLYARIRHLVPELAKFGVVGGIGAVIDLGGAAVLHSAYHQGPLKAKAISIAAATVVTYVGNRYWTFRHRENQPLLREGTLFVALNVVGLIIAEIVIACTTYVLGFKDPIAYNMASLVGTGLGTIFRYFAYRKWVFLAPAAQPAPAAEMGFADLPPWNAAPAAETGFADLPPWNAAPAPESFPEPAYAAQPSPAPLWLDQSRPPHDQPPSWSRQPSAQVTQVTQTPPWDHQPPAQTDKAFRQSSGGRHRKPRSA
jgi:putative flippase GtrA